MRRDAFHVELARLEVRCCCNPSRIYGTLSVRVTEAHRGARIHLEGFARQECGPVPRSAAEVGPPIERAVVHLEVDVCTDLDRSPLPFLALKYDDETITPREKLRRLSMLQTFEPSPEALAQWP